MAYQNVGTPRFYIDTPSYLSSIGVEYGEGFDKDLFGLNPSNPTLVFEEALAVQLNIGLPTEISNLFDTTKGYIGFLNHSISSDIYFQMTLETQFQAEQLTDIINIDKNNSPTHIENKGFSMWAFNNPDVWSSNIKINNIYYTDPITYEPIPFYMGGITFGSYYDMPHSPELDITMTIENDGYNTITTQGGAHLTNIRYNGVPMWERANGTQVPPWTIGEPTAIGRRRGRRVWSMNFKYLSDKDLFASNYMSNTYAENLDGYVDGDKDNYNWGQNIVTEPTFNTDTGWNINLCPLPILFNT